VYGNRRHRVVGCGRGPLSQGSRRGCPRGPEARSRSVPRACGRINNLAATSNRRPSGSQQLPTFQVKGRAIETRSIAPSDLERITRHQRAFKDEVVAVGMPEPSAVRLFSIEMEDAPEITNIRVLVEAVFNQTPGPGAGSRL
jgi:hypothetical protein